MDALLEVRGLSVDFLTPRGRVHALREVDLVVPRGEVMGLVGESGCGKTTLVSAVMNLLADNAEVRGGEVLFDGRDILGLGPGELRRLRGARIAMVFQDPMTALNPVLTIATQIRLAIEAHERVSGRAARARAVDVLTRVGIPDAGNRLDVALDHLQVARFQRADVDHHVDFPRAVVDGAARLVPFHVGGRRPEREADDRADTDARPRQQACGSCHPRRIDADGRKLELRRLAAQILDLPARGVRLALDP